MKHKRQKQAQKVMVFVEKHFGINPPYNIMVDATFVKEALVNKVNIWDQLPRYLGGDVRLYTTTCALKELEAFGKLLYGPLKIMREYKLAACPHKEFGVDPTDCLRKTVTRSHPDYVGPNKGGGGKKGKALKFFIATQHRELAQKIERTPGVPVMYLHGNAIVLEKISPASLEAAGVIRTAGMVPEHERDLKALFEKQGVPLEEEDGPIHHKRKLKGPNPLSVMKKRRPGHAPLSRAEKIRERRKWRRVRKRKGGQLGPLEELMMRELLTEDAVGWEGVVYRRKTLAELTEELEGGAMIVT